MKGHDGNESFLNHKEMGITTKKYNKNPSASLFRKLCLGRGLKILQAELELRGAGGTGRGEEGWGAKLREG